jgi:hypothetical protein
MFHASMERFQLELIYFYYLSSPSYHSIVENAVITTKGLRKETQLLNETTAKTGNKNKFKSM